MSWRDEALPFPRLETDDLILRENTPENADDIVRFMLDEKIYPFWGELLTAGARKRIADKDPIYLFGRETKGKNSGITWGIALKDDDRIIGEIFVNMVENGRMAHIGYRISHLHWGKGLMTQALRAVVAFVFEKTTLKRLYTQVQKGNESSCRVLEKCGFQKEGFVRQGKCFSVY